MMKKCLMSSIYQKYGEELEVILYRLLRDEFEKTGESGASFGKRVFGGTHTEASTQSKASRWFRGTQKLRVSEFYAVAKELNLIPDRIFFAAIHELESGMPKKIHGNPRARSIGQ